MFLREKMGTTIKKLVHKYFTKGVIETEVIETLKKLRNTEKYSGNTYQYVEALQYILKNTLQRKFNVFLFDSISVSKKVFTYTSFGFVHQILENIIPLFSFFSSNISEPVENSLRNTLQRIFSLI